jgi:hypothetical protein
MSREIDPLEDRVDALAYRGELVECTTAEYPAVRRLLTDAAARYLDTQQELRAQVILNELRRLDALHLTIT